MLRHVEYVLSAEFDLDTGPTVKFQYPQPIEGDERLMAELMLPDQIHSRTDDWTVFFLYKRPGETRLEYNVLDEDLKEAATKYYVLNLVNTKFDDALKRGALVRAMCIVTPHPFFQVFKPLLMLALDTYFKDPRIDHLATLYSCINSIDLSHGPKLTESEKRLMASTDYTSLFIEKFEEAQNEARAKQQQQQQQSAAVEEDIDGVSGAGPADGGPNQGLSRRSSSATAVAPHQPSFYLDLKSNTRLTPSATLVARDTHYFDATAVFNGMKIPLKVPTDCFPESAGDFSLIRLINMLNAINQPFATLHPHLTIYGPHTPPLLVLIFGLLTQKRILFVGLNTSSREVSEHVLACCAMVSGSILRSFSTHAFPYTDLSKVDELLATPGYIAGVKNPAFGHHPQWWDIIIDIDNQTMKISPEIAQPQPLPPQPAGVTSSSPTIGSTMSHTSASSISSDNTLAPLSTTVTTSAASVSGGGGSSSGHGHGHGHNSTQIAPEDYTFIEDLKSMLSKHFGEKAIRRRCQSYIRRFVRITTNYEEMRYGSTNLWPSVTDPTWNVCPGYGYSWADESQRNADLQLYAPVIEGWRASLSYRYYIDDLRYIWPKPPKYVIDYGFHMDRIRLQQLSYEESAAVFEVLAKHTQDYDDVNRLLMATKSTSLFYIAFGLFHRDEAVRFRVARLLSRIESHAAGRYYFQSISQFQKVAYKRILAEANKRSQNGVSF